MCARTSLSTPRTPHIIHLTQRFNFRDKVLRDSGLLDFALRTIMASASTNGGSTAAAPDRTRAALCEILTATLKRASLPDGVGTSVLLSNDVFAQLCQLAVAADTTPVLQCAMCRVIGARLCGDAAAQASCCCYCSLSLSLFLFLFFFLFLLHRRT